MSSPKNWNQPIIEEFRANGGRVNGYFADTTLLLLTTTGAKSGQPRTTPVAYVTDNGRYIIVASKAGAPTNPDWYYNLLAHPTATIEVGKERFQVRAAPTQEPERTRLYARMVERVPGFAGYERKTTRVIPVIALERID